MKFNKKMFGALLLACSVGAGVVYAAGFDTRTPVEFFTGHSHDEHGTNGAPSHSGGTNSQGCHNGSVPYHCH